jgi:hypothetical protein
VCIKTVPLNADTLAVAIARVHTEAFTEPLVGFWFGRWYAHVMEGAFDPVDLHCAMIPNCAMIPMIGASSNKSHRDEGCLSYLLHNLVGNKAVVIDEMFRQLTTTRAQPDHLEYRRASRARTRSAGGGVTGLSRRKPSAGAKQMSLS